MMRPRLALIVALHVALVLALLAWVAVETRRQQAGIERALLTEASVLAGSLGPALAAASNAMREFDEIVAWKLLDNARLLAELETSESLDRLRRIADLNGLETVAFLDRAGSVRKRLGEEPWPQLLDGIDGFLSGRADELVLGSTVDADAEHVAVAVRTPGGGAVLVGIHLDEARTFVRRLGVANLLDRLVDSGSVLYLSYEEEPGALRAAVSWDGGPIPAPPRIDQKLRPVRHRTTFETTVPVEVPAGGWASLRVGLDGTPLEHAAAAGMRTTLLVAIALAAYAVATTAYAVVSRLRSVEREESARRLARIETDRRRNERLAAAGALTAGLAHEIRSPLNAIGLAAQRLERKHSEERECVAFAGRIRQEVRRLEAILREFLDLARPVGEHRESVDLGELAAEVLDLLRPEAESRDVRFETVRNQAAVQADRDAVRRSVINLVRNAVEASPAGGRVRVVVDRHGNCGRLRITDHGQGVDPELQDRVFDPFVTTRAGGAGLGLALVKRVAEEHGGSCSLVNTAEGGAEACLCLPSEPGSRA